jgi:polyhydroxyalkanoate synthesis regulator phasin
MMSSARKRRGAFNPLSLAFLDVMSCGFGAVVLLFLILDHTAQEEQGEVDPAVEEEAALLDEEVEEGEENLVRLRNTLDDVSLEVVEAQGRATRIQQEIEDFRQQLAALEGDTLASEESVEQLRADVESMEEELLRLQASAPEDTGGAAREFLGDGERQYLSGMYMGGNRILILLDVSASMLDETLVNVIRTRNLPEENRRNAAKWRRAVRVVEWVVSQLPLNSQYQVYTFNDDIAPVLEGTAGEWLDVSNRELQEGLSQSLATLVPQSGSNLQRGFEAVTALAPVPDNIYLITDGLPTLSNRRNNMEGNVTPRQRMERYWDAVDGLQDNIPVNTILLPMEGDPGAAAAFWQLAYLTRGSFVTPSTDWP